MIRVNTLALKKPTWEKLTRAKCHFTLLTLSILSFFSISSSSQAAVSDLLISEIMADPVAVSDSNGEWFELFNPGNESVSLDGISLHDDGSNSVLLSGGGLSIASGSYFVLGRNGDSLTNGGFSADYEYGSGFTLGNSSDEIVFSDASGELLRFDYGSGFVDSGVSMELISDSMLASNFAASALAYGDGDFGTPGSAGSYAFSVEPSPVPLPGALWLFSSGLLGLIAVQRRRRSPAPASSARATPLAT
jgi:hypothetical protein